MRLCIFALLLSVGITQAAEKPKPADRSKAPRYDVRDFLLLGDAHPVLLRARLVVDGKPLRVVWHQFIRQVFDSLDLDKNGVLDQKEAERVPSANHLTQGSLGVFNRRWSGAKGKTFLERLDYDKSGKVEPKELMTWYRRTGLGAFQLKLEGGGLNQLQGLRAAYSGGKPEPPVDAIERASFQLLDVNRDGKLSLQELIAAPERAARQDENEDELITPQEIAPDDIPNLNPFGGMMMRPKSSKENFKGMVVPVNRADNGKRFLQALFSHFGKLDSKGDSPTGGATPAPPVKSKPTTESKPVAKKASAPITLTQKELRLSDRFFKKLDKDNNGSLNETELLGLINRPADLVVEVRLGKGIEPSVSLIRPKKFALGKLRAEDEHVLLDRGLSRVDLRGGGDPTPENPFGGLIRQQIMVQLKQADKNGDGVFDLAEVKKGGRFSVDLFNRIDRDGDSRVTVKQVEAYLDEIEKLAVQARRVCITLQVTDKSRGLFTLFDSNADNRLSVRELRQGKKLFQELARPKSATLSRSDIPKTHQLQFRLGPKDAGINAQTAFLALYSRQGNYDNAGYSTKGPNWFRKMDRNRDGDVSRKEFLFSKEQFEKLDADRDGLISAEEATRSTKQSQE